LDIHERTDHLTVEVPFIARNRAVLFDERVSTRYSHPERIDMDGRIADRLTSLLGRTRRNSLVLLPSYSHLDRIVPLMGDIGGELLLDGRGSSSSQLADLVSRFRKGNAVLVSVMGGRLSEGIDLPASELELVMIVGIPYPSPSAKQRALKRYGDIAYGDGYLHAVHTPASRMLRQAIGRLIRGPDDIGVALILDERAPRFTRDIQGLTPYKDDDVDLECIFNSLPGDLPISPLMSGNDRDTTIGGSHIHGNMDPGSFQVPEGIQEDLMPGFHDGHGDLSPTRSGRRSK